MGIFVRNVPPPLSDPIADKRTGLLTNPWIDYYTYLQQTVDAGAKRAAAVALVDQQASIGATDMTDGNLPGGLYKLSFYAYIQVAGGAGKVDISFGWTTGGTARTSEVYAIADATDPTASVSAPGLFIRIDGGSPVTYTTVAASAPTYGVDILLEAVQL